MAKVKKIRKWDEVTENAVEEQIPESIDPIEDVGAGPSISRNHMRGIEDMVEQNDNSFDGIINNVPAVPVPDFAEINEIYEEAFGDNKPARSCVQAGALPKGALIEIEVIAVK